jgi:protocatechuate 3,4-dioxygenase beta subunit
MTRRDALALGLSIPAIWVGTRIVRAEQGLGDFTTSGGAPSCTGVRTPTPATDAANYRPNAPERSSVRGPDTPGSPLHVTGFVIGLRCGVIKDARVELWQADAHGVYDQTGNRLRGVVRTTDKGAYAFDTIMPGAATQHARCLHLRVTPPGHPALATSLFFPDDPERTADPSFNPALVVKPLAASAGAAVTFDVVFDL